MKSYNPEMHTAEHVLNQTMVRMFGSGRSFSNHLERKKSKCDYHFERPLTTEEEKEIENTVNHILSLNLDISDEIIPRNIAEKEFNLEKIPGYSEEGIRIVRVGNYDACPCIGEHVKNTRDVGKFILGSSSFKNGVLRIRFRLQRPNR